MQLEQLQMGLKIIESEAAEIPHRYGMTKEELEALLANPSNFSPDDWQVIERARERSNWLKRELSAILPNSQGVKRPPSKKKLKAPQKNHWIPLP